MKAAIVESFAKEPSGFALCCCVLIRYFYCFKLGEVIRQVFARWMHRSTEGRETESGCMRS
jgi:hypothetical protein